MGVFELCNSLRSLQRERSVVIKSTNMQMNRLRAIVAGTLGYSNQMEKKDREKVFKEADIAIKKICAGEMEHSLKIVVETTMVGINAFEALNKALEKQMTLVAVQLPVAAWVNAPNQRGFGLLSLATIVGEAGDIANYPNPGKLWKRFGLAPIESNGKKLMPSTWRYGKEGKLVSEEWERAGYSPRRRSIAYLIGENIVKLNKSEYRQRYDYAKERIKAAHEDYSPKRCHLHGMLLASKLMLKNLWIEWIRTLGERSGEAETMFSKPYAAV